VKRVSGLLLLLAGAALAQSGPPLVRIDVVVTDPAGKPVTTLTRDSFRVLEDGEPREIRVFEPVQTPWNLILLLDDSVMPPPAASLFPAAQNPVLAAWRRMGEQITSFLALLGPEDRVLIASFRRNVRTLMDWRNARGVGNRNVEITPAPASTGAKDFYAAISWAVDTLRTVQGRKAVIVLTDGRDGRLGPQWLINEEKEEVFDPLFGLADSAEADDFLQTLEIVNSGGARFFFLAVNTNRIPDFRGRPISGIYPGMREAVGDYLSRIRVRIEHMAEVSGGRVLYGDLAPDAAIDYGRIHEDLLIGVRYTLHFAAAPETGDIPPRIEVQIREPGLRLHFTRAAR
jgi:VWFA-related protein